MASSPVKTRGKTKLVKRSRVRSGPDRLEGRYFDISKPLLHAEVLPRVQYAGSVRARWLIRRPRGHERPSVSMMSQCAQQHFTLEMRTWLQSRQTRRERPVSR